MKPQITEAGSKYVNSKEFVDEIQWISLKARQDGMCPEEIVGMLIRITVDGITELPEGASTQLELETFATENYELLYRTVARALGEAAERCFADARRCFAEAATDGLEAAGHA